MKVLINNIISLNSEKIELLKKINKPKIGWVSVYTPEEIIYAAGIIPFRITGEAGINTTEAGALLNNSFCSHVLSCLSEGIDGVYDFADGVVFIDACDMRKRLYEAWTHNLRLDYSFFLELPKDINPLSREYFRLQVRRLIESLESRFKCKITETALQEAISLFNASRGLLQRLHELRKSDAPPITGNESIQILKAGMSGLKEEFNKRLVSLLATLEAEKRAGTAKKHRVMICGSYFDNSQITDAIEKSGATLVCEDISNGIKYFEGQIDQNIAPADGIADYYLEKISCARTIDTDRRLKRLLNLIKEYGVDSIIYFSLKFCDTNLMDYPYIKAELMRKGIPVLFIEGEQHIENIENIKTRIQTFFETRIY